MPRFIRVETIIKSVAKKNKMESARTLESRLGLEPSLADIFDKVQTEFDLQRFGEEEHTKLECAIYKLEYDIYKMNRTRRDELLTYEGGPVSITIRKQIEKNPETSQFLTYTVKTPYLKDQIKFLRKIRTKISSSLLKDNSWLQGDERKTTVSKTINLQNLREVYPFLKSHIAYAVKTF